MQIGIYLYLYNERYQIIVLWEKKFKEVDHYPAQPENVPDLVILENYHEYNHSSIVNERFLLYDAAPAKTTLNINIWQRKSRKLVTYYEKIYMDDSFQIAQKLFTQVFVIMAKRNDFVLPVLYSLLPVKSRKF